MSMLYVSSDNLLAGDSNPIRNLTSGIFFQIIEPILKYIGISANLYALILKEKSLTVDLFRILSNFCKLQC